MSKNAYLLAIRANTTYPTYRAFINVLPSLAYFASGLLAAVGIIIGLLSGYPVAALGIGLASLVAAIMHFVRARFMREGGLILADLADSIVDANARNGAPDSSRNP